MPTPLTVTTRTSYTIADRTTLLAAARAAARKAGARVPVDVPAALRYLMTVLGEEVTDRPEDYGLRFGGHREVVVREAVEPGWLDGPPPGDPDPRTVLVDLVTPPSNDRDTPLDLSGLAIADSEYVLMVAARVAADTPDEPPPGTLADAVRVLTTHIDPTVLRAHPDRYGLRPDAMPTPHNGRCHPGDHPADHPTS